MRKRSDFTKHYGNLAEFLFPHCQVLPDAPTDPTSLLPNQPITSPSSSSFLPTHVLQISSIPQLVRVYLRTQRYHQDKTWDKADSGDTAATKHTGSGGAVWHCPGDTTHNQQNLSECGLSRLEQADGAVLTSGRWRVSGHDKCWAGAWLLGHFCSGVSFLLQTNDVKTAGKELRFSIKQTKAFLCHRTQVLHQMKPLQAGV